MLINYNEYLIVNVNVQNLEFTQSKNIHKCEVFRTEKKNAKLV